MTTALDIIKRAGRMVGVIAEGETPSAAQAQDALDTLNGMVGAWEAQGIRIGLPTLALADEIHLPASHLDPLAYNLAVALATEYGQDVRPAVAAKADEGLTVLRNLYVRAPELLPLPELWRAGRRYWGRFW